MIIIIIIININDSAYLQKGLMPLHLYFFFTVIRNSWHSLPMIRVT
jgi:hypothetical protein